MTARLQTRMIRVLQASLVVAAIFVMMGASDSNTRFDRLGHQLMCQCGCSQVLLECNHVGCTTSHTMLKELDERIARGDADDLILQSFIQEYGPTVLVDPPKRGFTGLVWFIPIIAPLIALYLVWELVRRWRQRAVLAPSGGPNISGDLLDRARQEASKEIDE